RRGRGAGVRAGGRRWWRGGECSRVELAQKVVPGRVRGVDYGFAQGRWHEDTTRDGREVPRSEIGRLPTEYPGAHLSVPASALGISSMLIFRATTVYAPLMRWIFTGATPSAIT